MDQSFDSKHAHVVYASDNLYVEILGVSLVSLYENSKDIKTWQRIVIVML